MLSCCLIVKSDEQYSNKSSACTGTDGMIIGLAIDRPSGWPMGPNIPLLVA